MTAVILHHRRDFHLQSLLDILSGISSQSLLQLQLQLQLLLILILAVVVIVLALLPSLLLIFLSALLLMLISTGGGEEEVESRNYTIQIISSSIPFS